jgi:hypothetical protein
LPWFCIAWPCFALALPFPSRPTTVGFKLNSLGRSRSDSWSADERINWSLKLKIRFEHVLTWNFKKPSGDRHDWDLGAAKAAQGAKFHISYNSMNSMQIIYFAHL